MRIDLIILKPEQIAAYFQSTLKIVFDPEGFYDQLNLQAPPRVRDPDKFLRQVEDFIRILGLLPLTASRRNTSMMGWMPHPAASQCVGMIAG